MTLHPVDWFTFYGTPQDVFRNVRDAHFITDNEVGIPTAEDPNPNKATFIFSAHMVEIKRANPYGVQGVISKFALLSAVQFKHDHQAAISYIQFELMHEPNPYIRVATDYFKVIHKLTRYGSVNTQIKHWKKEEIKQDHSRAFLQSIPKFDDFVTIPDNENYSAAQHNCYNLYSEFPHKPKEGPITTTLSFLKHIFQEHYELGLIYFQVLYLHPKQILPILCLVSRENETGKTTFINFLEMIFGGNFVLISPDDLTKSFNSNYATKNIIAIEETFVEKQTGVEKLKSLSTGKSVTMARKFIDDGPIPFFGKVILNTNKVKDFMRVDSKEIRFWVREVPQIQGKKNVLIEEQLLAEIPAFLYYLKSLPPINFDNGSRMVFTKEQLWTDALSELKNESRNWLFKELEILIQDFFDNNPTIRQFHASPIDIQQKWFAQNKQVTASWIRKTLNEEAGMEPVRSKTGKAIKYFRFGNESYDPISANPDRRTGFPYLFVRQDEPEQEPTL